MHLAGCAREAGAIEVRHEIDVMTEMALVAVMRVTLKMVELPGEGGSLDFFLGEVSVIARCNRISGGNGSCGKNFSRHEMIWEDPSVVGLDGAGAEGGTCRASDNKGSITVSANRVARCCECA